MKKIKRYRTRRDELFECIGQCIVLLWYFITYTSSIINSRIILFFYNSEVSDGPRSNRLIL